MTVWVRRPRRVLAAAALIDSAGDGLFLAGSALFFTRGMGLSVAVTGLGLTIAGVIGLLVGAEIGRVADRFGPREVFIALMTGQTFAVAAYTQVQGLVSLVAAATAGAICRQGAQAARGALVAQLGGDDAPGLRAYLHAVVNAGIAIGAALAGLAIAKDTHAAYVVLMLADAATFIVAAVIAAFLPRVPIVRSAAASKHVALADRRYVLLTCLSGVVALQFVVSGFLLPLWVVFHTAAPRWLASPLLLLNTVMIVLFQVRVSARFRGIRKAAGAYRLAGLTLLAAFGLFAAAVLPRNPELAATVLIGAMLVCSVGELLTGAGGFGLSFGLAPADAMGEYQGVWNLGFGASVALGPGLLTMVCLRGGPAGWVGLGLAVAGSGALIRRIALRALDDADRMPSSAPVCA